MTLALAEMYVQGVSTRKVSAITEQLCGLSITLSAVSQAARQLDLELEKWRVRPLGEYPFLFLDAYYEQVREDGQVRHLAVLVAMGVMTVFLTTQYLEEAEQLADRIAILHEGKIIANGTLAELKELFPPAKVEYIEKQPTLEEIFLAIIGKKEVKVQ